MVATGQGDESLADSTFHHQGIISGKYSLSIDKGRFVVPSKCRDWLGEEVYLFPLSQNRIQIWSKSAAEAGPWAEIEMRYRMHKTNPAVGYSYTQRGVLLGLYSQVIIDRQGRILLPAELRKYAAGCDGSQILTGAGDHMLLRTVADWENAVENSQSIVSNFIAEYD